MTYTTNFYFFNIQYWNGVISHFWSLAVEEQFYLIWPWLILFCNRKYFLHIIIGFIFIGVGSHYLLKDVKMGSILTFTCFDAFGLGALLSWFITYAKDKINKFYTVISIVAFISFALFSWGVFQNEWSIVPLRTLISIITLWLITYIIIHRDTNTLKFKFIFNNSVLIFLGKISYGLYLYHNFIPSTLNSKLVNVYINPLLPDVLYKKYWGQLYLVENIIMVVGISWLSYVLIEKRFLSMKKYFEYQHELPGKQK